MTELENLYGVIGGRFITPAAEIQDRLKNIKAFVFDWDGVFNNGQKTNSGGSCFSEVDSMGANLLRFSHYLKHGNMPLSAIISGEKNETAFYFSKREGFRYSYFKVPHKLEALKSLCEKEKLKPEEVAYFFDDVLDIPIAELCGIRIMVNHKVNPLLINYFKKHKLVDYLTSGTGSQYAVREACELLMGLNGNFDDVITGRKDNSRQYQDYIEMRRKIMTDFFTMENGKIVSAASPLG
ncbi:MAG: phosphatase [Bacteroidia bacterium]|nr:phosphatase [Bacteroidia bacterium]